MRLEEYTFILIPIRPEAFTAASLDKVVYAYLMKYCGCSYEDRHCVLWNDVTMSTTDKGYGQYAFGSFTGC